MSRSASPPAPLAAALAAVATLFAAPAALAAAGVDAGYRGRTSQGIVVTLSASASSQRSFRYRATLKCSDGTTWLDDYFTDRVTIASGHFSSRHTADRGAIVTTVTGTLDGRHANGTIGILERFSPILEPLGVTPLSPTGTIRCRSPRVRWRAVAP